MSDDKLYLGIDVGGNAVKLGLVDATGRLSGKGSIPTVDMVDKVACRAFAAQVGDFVHGMGVYSSELGGVGLAIPGIITPDSYTTPNVKADWPLLIDCVKRALSKPSVALINDANAAALGEMWMGAGTHARTALLVTLGSGVGAGLIIDGNVVSGGHGAAGEVGHLTVVPGGRPCKCGREGCVERYASARGIVQTFNEAASEEGIDASTFSDIVPAHETDALAVFHAFEAGDARAKRALDVMTDKLGFALSQVACVIDPDIILLGGGMAAGSNYYIDSLRESFRSYCLASCASTEIRCASLSGDAGVYGAARYAMQSLPRDSENRDWLDPDFGL